MSRGRSFSLLSALFAGFRFALTLVVLTASFGFNSFRSADDDFFHFIQWGPEGHVLARMLIAEEEGFFSYAGLMGKCGSIPPASQHVIYLHEKEVAGYELYRSQVGLQGQLAAAFELATPFDRRTTLRSLNVATAFLTALSVSVLLVWLGRRFGHPAWGVALLATLFSPWVTVLSRNLYWASWAFYLPLCAVIGLLCLEGRDRSPSMLQIFSLAFAAWLAKCLFNGYEFVTTTLVMTLTPLVMHAALDRWSPAKLFKWGVAIGLGSLAAVVTSMLVLCAQIAWVDGSFAAGVEHLLGAFERRSRGEFGDYPTGFGSALRASTGDVLRTYLSGTALGIERPFDGMHLQGLSRVGRITYGDVAGAFVLFSVIALALASWLRGGDDARKLVALVAGTWFASLAPLSWFVIFKAHAYVHTNVDFIVWHMPFLPVGFALVGCVAGVSGAKLWGALGQRRVSSRETRAS